MGTFFASVCTVAVVAGILTAAAATHISANAPERGHCRTSGQSCHESRSLVAAEGGNHPAKKTISIPAPSGAGLGEPQCMNWTRANRWSVPWPIQWPAGAHAKSAT